MKTLLNILPDFQTSPPGFERVLLRKLPAILLWGILLVLLPSVLLRLLESYTSIAVTVRTAKLVDILMFASFVVYCLAIFTIAIGAFLVKRMKGPAYVADAYPDEEEG